EILQPLTAPDRMRSPGAEGWRFKAIAAGETDLAFTAKPPVDPGTVAAPPRFTVTIRVKYPRPRMSRMSRSPVGIWFVRTAAIVSLAMVAACSTSHPPPRDAAPAGVDSAPTLNTRAVPSVAAPPAAPARRQPTAKKG